jgi:methyl-accepting chemotaxis protein
MQHAAQGTSDVAANIVDVSKGAADSSTASGNMPTAARSLAGESNRLKREMVKFLATVRAA